MSWVTCQRADGGEVCDCEGTAAEAGLRPRRGLPPRWDYGCAGIVGRNGLGPPARRAARAIARGPGAPDHDDVTLPWSGAPRCDIAVVLARPPRRGSAG